MKICKFQNTNVQIPKALFEGNIRHSVTPGSTCYSKSPQYRFPICHAPAYLSTDSHSLCPFLKLHSPQSLWLSIHLNNSVHCAQVLHSMVWLLICSQLCFWVISIALCACILKFTCLTTSFVYIQHLSPVCDKFLKWFLEHPNVQCRLKVLNLIIISW